MCVKVEIRFETEHVIGVTQKHLPVLHDRIAS